LPFPLLLKNQWDQQMNLTDRQWQAIRHLMPPVHQGRGIPARPVFVPQKLNNLHANLGWEFHRRYSLLTCPVIQEYPAGDRGSFD
jgi:hypothetical protein